MPVVRVLLVLFSGLLLAAPTVQAQQKTGAGSIESKSAASPPDRRERVLTLHLPLPPLLARLGEAAGLLEGPAKKPRRNAAAAPTPANPVLVLTLPLPKIFSTQVTDAPAAP
ncbi:hypothetical protein [Hymenobacter terrestris]|uniref:Uncharacterized protein n=1 Tax=Hymenobacter terrestris TaxID=2748310 RepID=A0ABX2Q5Q1_9BACT|nr:hypothetical protein [Hymenobacter terrestris]NVO86298.1 hypothetical protein [Hymenobacter terrestris]